MEFTSAASKRLREYAFLPSKKTKKYTEVHGLYLKGGHAYLQQALASPTPAASAPLYSLAAEAFSSAALVANRKLRSSSSSLSAYLEATLAYSAADDYPLAYESLRKAIEQRDVCVQRSSPVPPSASPTSPHSRPQALDKGRIKNRRSSDAGPIRDSRRGSQSVPASPLLSSRTPPLGAITAPGSPQAERKGGGVFSRMRKLMVRTEKEKAAVKDTKGGAATLTDVSPLPPLNLPVPAAPSSPNLPPPLSSSPFPAPPVQAPASSSAGKHLSVPATSAASSVAAPASPLMDLPSTRLAVGQVPSSTFALLDPRLSLQLAAVAAALCYWLWDDAQNKAALECADIALSLLSLLDDTSVLPPLPPSMLAHVRSSRLLLTARAAQLYLSFHSSEMEARPAYECDLRLLQRARDLFVLTVKLQSDGATGTRPPTGDDVHSADADDAGESLVKPPPLPSCLCTGLPSVSSSLFSACLCDALVLAYTGGFHARVLCTPPLLVTSLRLAPLFFDTAECKFVRQTYGLLQLSSSAPARLLEHPHTTASSHSPEEQYRRLLLSMWGNEILNEFITLLTRFMYLKRGLPQPPPPLSPTSAARERGEEGKVHPLVLMGGLVKDETEEMSQGQELDGLDSHSMQLLLKVKRVMKHNVQQPGFKYTH